MSQPQLSDIAHARRGPAREEQVSDATLTLRAARGDRLAIAAIWSRHRVMVRSVVLATLGPDTEIDDLVQEVFLELLRSVSQVRDGAALRAILARIAVRRVGMILRKRRIRSLILLLPWTQVPDVPTFAPDLDDRLAIGALYRVLDRVKRRPRLAFLLRHVHGMALGEVADALGVSLATTKRMIADARRTAVRLARREARLLRFLPPANEAER